MFFTLSEQMAPLSLEVLIPFNKPIELSMFETPAQEAVTNV